MSEQPDPQPAPKHRAGHRNPYVGEGLDGALRSAQIDREEAETYPTGSEEAARCLDSAVRWEQQAAEIEQTWLAMEPQGRP